MSACVQCETGGSTCPASVLSRPIEEMEPSFVMYHPYLTPLEVKLPYRSRKSEPMRALGSPASVFQMGTRPMLHTCLVGTHYVQKDSTARTCVCMLIDHCKLQNGGPSQFIIRSTASVGEG
jgi:hypothetical protein